MHTVWQMWKNRVQDQKLFTIDQSKMKKQKKKLKKQNLNTFFFLML